MADFDDKQARPQAAPTTAAKRAPAPAPKRPLGIMTPHRTVPKPTHSLDAPKRPMRPIQSDQAGSDPHSNTANEYDQVVVTNVVAAQRVLDELVRDLDSQRPPGASSVADRLARANLYLQESLDTSVLATHTNRDLASAISSLDGARAEVERAVARHADPVLTQQTAQARDGLDRRVAVLRGNYDVTESGHHSTLRGSAHGDTPEIDAIRASLHLAEMVASRGFQRLLGTGGDFSHRLDSVQRTATTLVGHLGHAARILAGPLDNRARAALRPAVQAASAKVLLIDLWIATREGNARMRAAYAGVVSATNRARKGVGMGELGREAAEGYPADAVKSGKAEDQQMRSALSKYYGAWDSLEEVMCSGVREWYELAKLEDQQQPSFVLSLATALLTAALGNISGLVAKGLIRAAANDRVKQAAQEVWSNTYSDTYQSILGGALNEAIEKSGSATNLKALLYVRYGLEQICRGLRQQHCNKLSDQVAAGQHSVPDVEGLAAAVQKLEASKKAQMKFQSATEWVRYVAQSKLGGQEADGTRSEPTPDRITSPVSDLDGYFGSQSKDGEGGTPTSAPRDRTGTSGMFRVYATTYGDNPAYPTGMAIKKLNVSGLNREMANLLVDGPEVRCLDDLKVPKEVVLEFYFATIGGPSHPRLLLAIDEAGKVRDSKVVAGVASMVPDRNIAPDVWWNLLRRIPISRALVSH